VDKTNPAYILADKTSWVVKGVKEWLWIFANTDFP
jgi:hypothetical protein